MKIFNQNYNRRGVSIYLALMIISILLASALGVSVIFVNQIKILKEIKNSVLSFYAADAGIEQILLSRSNPGSSPAASCTEASPCSFSNGATYFFDIAARGAGGCAAQNYCIKSIGGYKETNRAIEITY